MIYMASDYRIFHTAAHRILHVHGEEKIAEMTAAGMVAAVEILKETTGISIRLPLINVFLAPNRMEFDKLVAHLTSIPTHPSRIGQPQGNDLYLISPSAWSRDAVPSLLTPDGGFDHGMYRRLLIHETVHIWEEFISPHGSMEVRPSWFSEGLAVYVSGQYNRDRDMVDAVNEKRKSGLIPELNRFKGPDAYLWGWMVIRFLIRRFSWERIVTVLKENCSEDVLSDFGPGLEKEWHIALD